jgi:hypothetical protein
MPELEQFQEKWVPIFRPELRKNKEIEHFLESKKNNALEQFQEKWAPVFRPELRKNEEIQHFRDSKKNGNALGRWAGCNPGARRAG